MTVTPEGKTVMTGADALPWALDTLAVGQDVRSKFTRLQAWVKALLGDK